MTYIIKATGKKEEFNKAKIFNTLIKAGASQKFARNITGQIEKKIYNGISSKKILNLVLNLLKEKPEIASRYDLKRAIMSLGPSGFPYEKFFAKVLENYGFKTEIGKIISGKNITHEVDIIAKKKIKKNGQIKNNAKEFTYMVECKYHNQLGTHTNIKVALYTYARFLDLKNNKKYNFNSPWLTTNTKCTPDAMNYAKSVNMKITTWNYPRGKSLQELIEKKQLYPITIIKSMENNIKEKLSDLGIIITKDLLNYDFNELKSKTGFSEKILNQIIKEAKEVSDN
jgi:hypothetical protein